MLKSRIQPIAIVLLCCSALFAQSVPPPTINHPALSKLKWQLACQAATFGKITFFDMVDQLHAMGVHHIELSPGQVLNADSPAVKIDEQMTDPQIEVLEGKLKSVKMDVVSYGVVSLTDERNAQAILGFAKKLRVKNLVVEPSNISAETLDKIATEAGVHVAILSRPPAGDCDALLKLLKDRSAMVGVCLDVGALERAKVSIGDCAQKLGGKIVEVNLTDIGDSSGGGQNDLTAILTQLKKQGFKGIFGVGTSSPDKWSGAVDVFSAGVTKAADAP